ncbi:hypothetical protein [Azospirillum palustre]
MKSVCGTDCLRFPLIRRSHSKIGCFASLSEIKAPNNKGCGSV